jgi:hypothetical protein
MASRQAERGLEPFQVLWLLLSIDDLKNYLTMVHSIDGMHSTARSALLRLIDHDEKTSLFWLADFSLSHLIR